MSGLLDLTLLSCLHLGLDLAMPFNHPYLATSLAGACMTQKSFLKSSFVYTDVA